MMKLRIVRPVIAECLFCFKAFQKAAVISLCAAMRTAIRVQLPGQGQHPAGLPR